jgi:hypothetical protein
MPNSIAAPRVRVRTGRPACVRQSYLIGALELPEASPAPFVVIKNRKCRLLFRLRRRECALKYG